MHCPMCEGLTHVVETFTDVDEIHRLRECHKCQHRFLTGEQEVPYGLITKLRQFKLAKLKARKDHHGTTKSPTARRYPSSRV